MNRIKVVVTGAAGQIGYSLIPRLVDGFHSDDEEELGSKPIIASISLGENRPLIFKHKKEDITHRIG